MKRGISLLMVLCMVVSLCSTIFVSAAPPAQEVTETEAAAPDAQISNALVSQIHVSGVTVPVAGQTPTVDGITCDVPGVTITAEWMQRGYIEELGVVWGNALDAFTGGNIYALWLELEATDARFRGGKNLNISVNGADDIYFDLYSDTKLYIEAYYCLESTPITDLTITGVGDTSVGAVMTTQGLQAENAYITAYWVYEGSEEYEDGVSVFEDGKNYELWVYLEPALGYCFTKDMAISFDGYPDSDSWGTNVLGAYVDMMVYHEKPRVEEVALSGAIPYEIEPGPAPQVSANVSYGEATVAEVYWADAQDQRVTAFENGKAYYLNVKLTADEGYQFTEETYIYDEGDCQNWDLDIVDESTAIAYSRYSLIPVAEYLDIVVSGVQIGNKSSDVTVEVTNLDAQCTVEVHDIDAQEIEDEVIFRDGGAYRAAMSIVPDAYELSSDTVITVNGEKPEGEIIWGEDCEVWQYFSFKPHVERVDITVAEPVIGEAPGEAVVAENDSYALGYYYWNNFSDDEMMEPGDVFEDGKDYGIYIDIRSKNGYDFTSDTEVFINGQKEYFDGTDSHTCITGGLDFSFVKPEVERVALTNTLPDQIEPGAAPQVDVSVREGEATVSEVYWTDAQSNPVTTLQEGKVYYLNVKLAAAEGYRFTEDANIYVGDGDYWPDESVFVDENTFIVQFRYSLLPKAEKVEITISGLEIGKKIEDMTVTVDNLDLQAVVEVYDVDEDPLTEKFQDGKAYNVYIALVNEAYDLSVARLFVNGQEYYAYEGYNEYMDIWYYASFKKHIDKVELTVPQPAVGQTPGTLTVPAGANYAIGYFYWLNEDTYELVRPNEKFQDGGRYRLHYAITPYGGYDFAENVVVTVNGKKSDWYDPDNISGHLEGNHRWSFCKPIEKVELPAFPTNVKPGDAPKLTLTDTDQYTLGYIWVDVFADEAATKLDNGKCYVLAIYVEPKAGYETALGVTRIMVDGEEYYGWLSDLDSITVIKTYNLNQKAVDRIDLNVTAPALGATPTKITASNSDKYEITYTQWFEGSGNLYEEKDEVVGPFTTGKYYYATISVGSLNGYAITEDTAIYVNGVKVSPKLYLAMGTGSEIVLVYQPLSDGAGDMDGDGAVNNKDVEYLLWHTLFPGSYPVSKDVDFDGNGQVNNKDVEYLLWHTLFPDSYPLS